MKERICRWAACLILLATIALPPEAAAEGGATSSKLTIHGFLTQAYAWTDGAQLLGIPGDGTFDYRDMALQFRYEITERDAMVIQFANERKGSSPIQELNEDVQLDWAFYERRLTDSASVRVGRVPLPAGIYNEIRDVGTILPFFAPPFSIYQDVSFTSETVDGIVLSNRFALGSRWSLDADLYYGGWTTIESFSGLGIAPAEAEQAIGLQLWLGTPITGLRFGLGFNRYDLTGGVTRLDDEDTWRGLYLSLDGDFDRLIVRAELYRRYVEAQAFGIPIPDATADAYYFQLGVRLSDRWTLWGQADFQELDPGLPGAEATDLWEDYALSLSHSFSANLLLRAEYHWNESYWVEDRPANFFLGNPPTETDYGIVSLAISF